MIFIKHKFKKRSKYNAKKTVRDGIKFASIKEANYYDQLKLRKQAGEIIFFLMQVPFHLPGNIIYRVDFQEFHADETVHFVDVKGYETKEFIIKKKQVEDLYPVIIEIV